MTDAPWESSSTPPLEIAHVLFMDIVAYSTLHMDRQQRLLHDLQEAVCNTPTFARARAEDQLISLPTGDGMALVFFRDPEAPVHCALELSRTLRHQPDVRLRMGIHSGPVYRVADINANRNVAGGGINIAQRVMDCCDAGHILVSEETARILGQVSAWKGCLKDLGETDVKHAVRIHLFNLCTQEAGNPEVPRKLSISSTPSTLESSLLRRFFLLFGTTPYRRWEIAHLRMCLWSLFIGYLGWRFTLWTPERWGLILFFLELVCIVLLWVLLSLPLYMGAFDARRLPHQVRKMAPWIRGSTLALVVVTWTMAGTLGGSHSGLAVLLALCGASGAFGVLWFKPAIDRAAFPKPH